MRTFGGGEKRGILKKGDICRDEVSICVRRVASIISLKLRITQKDTYGFSREFVLARSKNVDKARATNDMQGKTEKRLARKEKRMRNLII